MIKVIPLSDRAHSILIFVLLVLITNITMIASTGVVIVTPVVIGDLAISQNLSLWITTGYLIVIASTVPCSIYIAEKFGYKITLIMGTLAYSIFSCLCGLSDHFYAFIFFRLLSGIGVGIIFPISLPILNQLFSSQYQGLILALYSAFGFGGGTVIGFFAGGMIAQYSDWNWIFILDALIGIPLAFFLMIFLRHKDTRPVGGFDVKGYILYIIFAGSTVSLLATAKAPWNTESWNSSFSITCLILSIVSFVLFIIEEKTKENPLFYLKLFKYQSFTLGCILLFFVGGLFFGTASLFPTLLIDYLKYSKIQAALHMIIYGLSVGIVGGLSGMILKKVGAGTIIIIGGMIMVFDLFAQHIFSVYSDHVYILTLLALRGTGVGMTFGPITAWALKDIPIELKGNASIIITIFRQLGGGLLGTIINVIAYVRYQVHSTHFFEAFDFSRTGIKTYFEIMVKENYHRYGEGIAITKKQAQAQIIDLIERQARLLAYNDAFFILAWIFGTLILVVAIILIMQFIKIKIKKSHKIFD